MLSLKRFLKVEELRIILYKLLSLTKDPRLFYYSLLAMKSLAITINKKKLVVVVEGTCIDPKIRIYSDDPAKIMKNPKYCFDNISMKTSPHLRTILPDLDFPLKYISAVVVMEGNFDISKN